MARGATGAITALIAVGSRVGPVFISPLFNDYKPMAAGPLRDQILAMAQANQSARPTMSMSSTSRSRPSAFRPMFPALGPTIRISLNDNLLNRTSPAEVKAVMGHELGHYVLNHIGKSIALARVDRRASACSCCGG